MFYQAKINEYGKDKLKNLAKYTKQTFYPIIHSWHDLHNTEPKKYVLYFAMPDDRGNTFVIPAKWCENIEELDISNIVFELNESAQEQLSKAGNFPKERAFAVIKMWEDVPPNNDQKRKFDMYFAILDENGKVFIVQSTWGKLVLLDAEGNPIC